VATVLWDVSITSIPSKSIKPVDGGLIYINQMCKNILHLLDEVIKDDFNCTADVCSNRLDRYQNQLNAVGVNLRLDYTLTDGSGELDMDSIAECFVAQAKLYYRIISHYSKWDDKSFELVDYDVEEDVIHATIRCLNPNCKCSGSWLITC
jgi:hypothetical protein